MTTSNNERDVMLDRLHAMNNSLSIIRGDVEMMKKYYDKIDTVLDKMTSQYVSIAVQEQKLTAITGRLSELEKLVKEGMDIMKKDIDSIEEKVSYFDQIKWKILGAIAAGGVFLSIIDFKDIVKLFTGV